MRAERRMSRPRWAVDGQTGKAPVAFLGYSGLHPGCMIEVTDLAGTREAAVCCLLLDDQDRPHALLTAGHVFVRGTKNAVVRAAVGGTTASIVVGKKVTNLLDLVPATTPTTDAAAVELTEAGKQLAKKAVWPCRFTNAVPAAAPLPKTGRVWLATRKQPVTGCLALSALAAPQQVAAPVRPAGYEVCGLIAAAKAGTRRGDSGTFLCTDIADGELIGLCVGAKTGQSYFVSAATAIAALSKAMGMGLKLWR